MALVFLLERLEASMADVSVGSLITSTGDLLDLPSADWTVG